MTLEVSDNSWHFLAMKCYFNVIYAFLKDISLKESCHHCIYAQKNRVGDITLGDFWALKTDVPYSIVMINTSKGQKIMNKINSISLEEKNLKAYIFSIVANECVNHMREVEYCDELCENQSDEDFFEKLHIKDRYAEIVRAIEDLDDKYSIVMLFRYRDEMDVKSIAALLGLPEKTVYTRLLRGKALLLKALPEEAKHADTDD